MKKLIMSVLLVNLLAACGSNPPKAAVTETTPAQAAQAPVVSASAGTAASTQAAAPTQAEANASAEAKAQATAEPEAAQAAAEAEANVAALAKRSVFFPFDVDAVQAADRETILAHGQNLSEHANLRVRVEGNADERGSSEYNLALGQRRANNTKKALVLGGARSSQVETVSYGEEKPRATEHDEAAWAQNRRADIVYSSGR